MNELISDFEELWGLKFCDMHQALLQRPYDDPEILKLGLLVIGADIELMNIDHVNEMVHDEDRTMPWPDGLIAFATNECGDYFAYRINGPRSDIVYVGPEDDPALILREGRADSLQFEHWQAKRMGR